MNCTDKALASALRNLDKMAATSRTEGRGKGKKWVSNQAPLELLQTTIILFSCSTASTIKQMHFKNMYSASLKILLRKTVRDSMPYARVTLQVGGKV